MNSVSGKDIPLQKAHEFIAKFHQGKTLTSKEISVLEQTFQKLTPLRAFRPLWRVIAKIIESVKGQKK